MLMVSLTMNSANSWYSILQGEISSKAGEPVMEVSWKSRALEDSLGVIQQVATRLMPINLVLLNYREQAKFTLDSYALVFFIPKEKTGSSNPLHPPLISCMVGNCFVEDGITSCKSPTQNWNARDCQNSSVKVTSSAFKLTAYLRQDFMRLLLTNSCRPPKVLVSNGSKGTGSPHQKVLSFLIDWLKRRYSPSYARVELTSILVKLISYAPLYPMYSQKMYLSNLSVTSSITFCLRIAQRLAFITLSKLSLTVVWLFFNLLSILLSISQSAARQGSMVLREMPLVITRGYEQDRCHCNQ